MHSQSISHFITHPSILRNGGITLMLLATLLFGACKKNETPEPSSWGTTDYGDSFDDLIAADQPGSDSDKPHAPIQSFPDSGDKAEAPLESQTSHSYTPNTSHSYEPVTSHSYEPNTSQSYTPNTSHSYTPTTSISYEPRAQEESIAETELHDRE